MTVVASNTANTATSDGQNLTSDVTANTKGAWVEAIASTPEETFWIALSLKSNNADTNHLIDIGVGAAASEVVQIANISFFGNFQETIYLLMPRTIASGARVSLRSQSAIASGSLQFMIFLSNDSTFGTSTQNITMGADTSLSKGTEIDPGAVEDTKGAYVELDASTSIEVNYIVLMMGNNDNAAQAAQDYLVDISSGGAGSETDDISNMMFFSRSVESASSVAPVYQTFPSGTRVSTRGQNSDDTVGGTDRRFDVSILGFKLEGAAGGGIAHIVGQGGIVG